MREPVEVDFAARRRPQPAEELSSEARRWLEELPPNVRPHRLAAEFPRIANTLVRRWNTPHFCLEYFDELLIDARGNRRGFPLAVMLDIAELKSHFQMTVHWTPRTVWDEIVNRPRD